MTTTPEQKKRLLKAKIAVALRDELGRVPKEAEINQVFLLTPSNVEVSAEERRRLHEHGYGEG